MIPKNLIYAWFGDKKKPDRVVKNLKNWKKLCPDFKIIEINEQNFDVCSFEFTKKAYEMKKWAFVSDVARMWAVYEYGGIYLDTDVKILKPLDKLLNHSEFWAKEDEQFIASGLIFGAEKNNVDVSQILDKYRIIKSFPDDDRLFEVSTTRIVTGYFREQGLLVGNKVQCLPNDIIVYPAVYFAPLHYWGGGRISDNSITVHQYAASWVNDKYGFFRRCVRYIAHQLGYKFPVFSIAMREMMDMYKR